MTSCYLNNLFKDLVFKYGHFPRSWGLELQHRNLAGDKVLKMVFAHRKHLIDNSCYDYYLLHKQGIEIAKIPAHIFTGQFSYFRLNF